MARLRLIAAGRGAVEDLQTVADGGERVAQFVREDGQELVLAPVGFAEIVIGGFQFAGPLPDQIFEMFAVCLQFDLDLLVFGDLLL